MNDKINVNCELPEEDACCVINVYQNINGTRTLLSTNPEYKATNNILFGGQIETRTCFQTENRLLNAYYTSKELRPDEEYELETLCTSETDSYRTIKPITPVYKTPNQALYRAKWAGDNPVLIVFLIFITIIAIITITYVFNKFRGR